MIPLVPFPIDKAKRVSRIFLSIGNAISKTKPSLKLELYQAEVDISTREYCSIIIFSTIFYFILLTALPLIIGIMVGTIDILISLIIGFAFSGFVFFYLLNWPKLIGRRKIREIDRDILNALHHLLIEIKSGVPLFNAMVGVSEGYGKVSEEFKKIVKEINAGTPETDALNTASQRNPSLYFRRSIWQIVNAMKAGSDIGAALEAIVDNIVKEQMIAIRKYGQQLNPYTMMYMLFAVILPSLGITFLIIISSFSGIMIPKIIFPLIIFVLVAFQFFYMGLIKTKRPAVEV
ncbi:MAG: type II secretion system F family protein [Candidatus Aenigmatarchaeota archaeon]